MAILISLTIFCGMVVYSQKSKTTIKTLVIGQQVPDIHFGPIIKNNRTTYLKMSDFRGKLVILDFWATYCHSCIEAFPKLDSLQRLFGNKLEIILVNDRPKKQFDDYMSVLKKEHSKYYRMPNLLSVENDKVLNALFKHTAIPHEVWIDPEGKVCGITEGHDVTSSNIAEKLRDPKFHLPEKVDWLDFKPEEPLVPQLFTTMGEPLKFYSTILNYKQGYANGAAIYEIDSAKQIIRISRNPTSILMLYAGVLGHWSDSYAYPYDWNYFDYGKRVVLEVADSSNYIQPKIPDENWKTKHWFGYESIRPLECTDSVDGYTLSDMNRFFGINGRIEKRNMLTLAIVRTSDKEKFKSANDKNARFRDDSTLHFRMYHTRFKTFRTRLADTYKDSQYIFNDNTGYKQLVDLELQSNLNDLPSLRKELQSKYDLDIIEKMQPVDVMVITEKTYHNSR